MELLRNISNYKKEEPNYQMWKQEQLTEEARREKFVQAAPLDAKTLDEAKKRGEVLTRAVDILDEYSQMRAEDVEVVAQTAQGLVGEIVALGVSLPLAIFAVSKKGAPVIGKLVEKLSKFKRFKNQDPGMLKVLAAGVFMMVPTFLATMVAAIPMSFYTAKMKVGASRIARFDGMKSELSHENDFAMLTDEQKQKAQEIAKTIPDEPKKSKIAEAFSNMNPLVPFSRVKELLNKRKEYEAHKIEYEKSVDAQQTNFGQPLTEEEALKAKTDQKVLAELVEKIDIASQDYSERAELMANIGMMAAMAGGGVSGFIINKIMNTLKVKNPIAKRVITIGVPVAMVLYMTTIAAGIKKQASRVGRFKQAQEMTKDPSNFAYFSDEQLKSVGDVKPKELAKDKSFFGFLKQLMADNKEFNEYENTVGKENRKLKKAARQLELTEQQKTDAKRLQKNTFRMFNEVDDKSQQYAESIEAVKDAVQTALGVLVPLAGAGIGGWLHKILKANEKHLMKFIGGGYLVSLLPLIGMQIYATKEQRKASRVADMLAIKELNDYREFALYDKAESQKPA